MADSRKNKIRYGLVGLGNIAQVAVLPAFQHATKNSELVALFSSEGIVKAASLGRKLALTPIDRDQRPSPRLEMRKPATRKVAAVHAHEQVTELT